MDILTPAQRSERMARIRSSNTAPELSLRKQLHALGLRYRLGGAGLPGKPDLVLPRYRTAIFVHGCFWHRHSGCSIATTPKSRTQFWLQKFERNTDRDRRVTQELKDLGWLVLIAWECELNSTARARATVDRLAVELKRACRLIVSSDTSPARRVSRRPARGTLNATAGSEE